MLDFNVVREKSQRDKFHLQCDKSNPAKEQRMEKLFSYNEESRSKVVTKADNESCKLSLNGKKLVK